MDETAGMYVEQRFFNSNSKIGNRHTLVLARLKIGMCLKRDYPKGFAGRVVQLLNRCSEPFQITAN